MRMEYNNWKEKVVSSEWLTYLHASVLALLFLRRLLLFLLLCLMEKRHFVSYSCTLCFLEKICIIIIALN